MRPLTGVTSRGASTGEVTGIRIVRGRRSRVLRRDGPRGQRSHLGRLLIRLLDGELDFIFISSMTAVSPALSRKVAELVESRCRFRQSASLVIGVSRSLLPAAGKFSIVQPGRRQERIGAWRARAISSWTATST